MKHQSYIRSLFVAFCAFFVCVSAMAGELNPFAFKLSSKLEGDVFIVTYYLNAPATNVDVIVDIDNDGVDDGDVVYNCNALKNAKGKPLVKGIYTATISLRKKINELAAFRNKNKLHWYVDVKGGNEAVYPTGGVTLNSDKKLEAKSYKFYNAGSVDIDINPFSDNFGIVYVVERRLTDLTGDYYTIQDNKNRPGVYVFDPAFQNMPVKRGANIYTFEDGTLDNTKQKSYSFNASNPLGWSGLDNLHTGVRLAYDKPDSKGNVKTRLYCATQSTAGALLMYGNTDKMNPLLTNDYDGWFKKVFNGTRTTDGKYWLTKNSTFVAGPNIIFDVQDDAEGNRRLLMVSGWPTSIDSRDSYRCDEYNLKDYDYTSEDVNYTPVTTGIFEQKETGVANLWYRNSWSGTNNNKPMGFVISADLLGIEYDQDGKGFWLCQSRDHHSGMPSLTHFMKQGNKYVVNFIEYWAGRGKDAVRYDNSYQRLAVSGGPFYFKESESSYYESKFATKTVVKGGTTYYKHPAAREGYVTIYKVKQSELKTQFIDITNEQTKVGTTVTTEDRKTIFTDSVYLYLGKEADGTTDLRAQDFAWDYADNLYVAMGSHHKIAAFALPKGPNPVSTPCKQDYYFDSKTYQLTITIAPANTGEVLDNEFREEYRYYMKDAKFKLLAVPETGYRFYCWDDTDIKYPNTIGATLTSEHTMTEDYDRTAHFGIDVWETKAITQTDKEMTFRGVFVQRELDTESYSTICLPFNLTTLEGTPYDGASVLKFDEAEDSDVAGDNRTFLTFKEVTFKNGDIMEAGKPYLIKVNTPIAKGEEKIFKNVTCPPIGTQGQSVTHNGVTFYGLLNPTTFTAAQLKDMLFLTADNRLVTLYGQNSVNINGLRGYFTVRGGMAKTAEFVLNLPEKVTTSIPMVNIADSLQVTKYLWNGQIYIQRGNEVYDLSGARVK